MEGRKELVKLLMNHPGYLQLRVQERLSLVQKSASGISFSAIVLCMKALHWVRTGKLE